MSSHLAEVRNLHHKHIRSCQECWRISPRTCPVAGGIRRCLQPSDACNRWNKNQKNWFPLYNILSSFRRFKIPRTLATGVVESLLEAIVTDALEGTHHVLAHAMRTNATRATAFVHIATLQAVVRQLVALLALACERSIRVDTYSAFANVVDCCTFINIWNLITPIEIWFSRATNWPFSTFNSSIKFDVLSPTSLY